MTGSMTSVTAAPAPYCNCKIAFEYATSTYGAVTSPGPPWVSNQTRSKLLNVQIDDRVTVTVSTWRSPGSVTLVNRCNDEAPSIVAAS